MRAYCSFYFIISRRSEILASLVRNINLFTFADFYWVTYLLLF